MTDVTNILNKLAGGEKFRVTLIKRRPWEQTQTPMTFTLELVRADLNEDLTLDMNFIVSKLQLNNSWPDKETFIRVFNHYDVQDQLKDNIFNSYKVSALGVESPYEVNTDYKFR